MIYDFQRKEKPADNSLLKNVSVEKETQMLEKEKENERENNSNKD